MNGREPLRGSLTFLDRIWPNDIQSAPSWFAQSPVRKVRPPACDLAQQTVRTTFLRPHPVSRTLLSDARPSDTLQPAEAGQECPAYFSFVHPPGKPWLHRHEW